MKATMSIAMSARPRIGGRDDTDKNLESLGARDDKRDTSLVLPSLSSIHRISPFLSIQGSFAIDIFRPPTSLRHNRSVSSHAYMHQSLDAFPHFERRA